MTALKTIFLWAIVLFVVVQGLGFLFTILVGQDLGLLITVVIGVLFAGIVGFKAEQSYIKSMVAQKGSYVKGNALMVGFLISVVYGILSSLLLYFTTGKFSYNSGGVATIAITIIGAYLAEKKFLSAAPQTQVTTPPVKAGSTKGAVIGFVGTLLYFVLVTILVIFNQSTWHIDQGAIVAYILLVTFGLAALVYGSVGIKNKSILMFGSTHTGTGAIYIGTFVSVLGLLSLGVFLYMVHII